MASTRDTRQDDREAADWFARLKAGTVSLDELERFKAWRDDPSHRTAYEGVEAIWRRSGGLSSDPDIVAAVGRIPPLAEARSRRRVSAWATLGAGAVLAASLAAVLVIQAPATYDTRPGEHRTVRLEDGSSLVLDTNTRVEVRYSRNGRNLVLARGQAVFDVAHDAARPFLVRAGDTTVRALGTRFDVRREGEIVQVTLVRGSVDVRRAEGGGQWRLAPGDQVVSRPQAAGRSVRPVKVDPAVVTRWTEGRVVFASTPLAAAIAEMNRYAEAPIVLNAPGLAHKPVSGEFDTGNAVGFAEAVSQIYGLRLTRTPAGESVLSVPSV